MVYHDDDSVAAPRHDHRRRALFNGWDDPTEARGGTPYGASSIAGPRGELTPTPEDLAICRVQGKRVAQIAQRVRR